SNKLRDMGYNSSKYFSDELLTLAKWSVFPSGKCYYVENLSDFDRSILNHAILEHNAELIAQVSKTRDELYTEKGCTSLASKIKKEYLSKFEKAYGIKLFNKHEVEDFLIKKQNELLSEAKDDEELVK
ncbi:MAG: hypothetical protein KBT30_02165, partial [Clostridiales bacterium]|nr:hypothetical protein [Candidatus Apopatousia equi]